MHRECLLGVALAKALQEIEEENGVQLTPLQRRAIWQCYDATMDEVLRDVPRGSVVAVEAPSPAELVRKEIERRARRSSGDVELAAKRTRPESGGTADLPIDDKGAEAVELPFSALNFPMYRCIDGVWTIILKDPMVTICCSSAAGGGGAVQETLHLDYLKIVAKEIGAGAGRKRKKP